MGVALESGNRFALEKGVAARYGKLESGRGHGLGRSPSGGKT